MYMQIKKSMVCAAMRERTGFTLIELLVVIAIIAVLAAILFPVFSKAREKAKQATCVSTLKDLGLAFNMYSQDYDNFLPPYGLTTASGPYWTQIVTPYIKGGSEYNYFGYSNIALGGYRPCPSRTNNTSYTYGVNYGSVYGVFGYSEYYNSSRRQIPLIDLNPSCFLVGDARIDRIGNPREYPFDKDSDGDGVKDSNSWGGLGIYNGATERHSDGMNFLFADGSVRWVALSDFMGNKNKMWNR